MTFYAVFFLPFFLLMACTHAPKIVIEPPPPLTVSGPGTQSELPGDDERFEMLRELGFAHYLRGDLPRAMAQLEAGFLADPQASEVWPRFILQYCYLATGEYRSARTLGEELVRMAPYDPLAYQQVGMAQLWLGDIANAQRSFQRALDFESHSPRVHFYVGLAHQRMKQTGARDKAFAEAESEYTQILEKNPRDFLANYELASLYLFWNRSSDRAARLIATARESVTTSPNENVAPERKAFIDYYLPLVEGILLHREGKALASMESLYRSLANLPSGSRADMAEIYFYLGKARSQLGDREGAKAFLEKGIGLDPGGPYVNDMQVAIREIATWRRSSR